MKKKKLLLIFSKETAVQRKNVLHAEPHYADGWEKRGEEGENKGRNEEEGKRVKRVSEGERTGRKRRKRSERR